jgi:hypothetical protein
MITAVQMIGSHTPAASSPAASALGSVDLPSFSGQGITVEVKTKINRNFTFG